MANSQRKEAGADFSDRPKSRGEPGPDDWVLVRGFEDFGRAKIAWDDRELGLARWENGERCLVVRDEIIFPIPARSCSDEPGTDERIRAKDEQ